MQKTYKGEELKDELGISSVVNAYMVLASLGIGNSITTRYGSVTRTSEKEFSITFKRKSELEYKMNGSMEKHE